MIEKTTAYDQFQSITANRETDPRHVKQLKKSIQENNLLHLNPIIVNSAMEVIDGQHRLAAAIELGTEIFFIKDDKVKAEDIAKLNSNQSNWKPLDYVNYYCVNKVPEFLELSRLIRTFSFASVSTILSLCAAGGCRDSQGFKEGKIDISNIDKAIEILEHIDQIRNIGVEEAYDRNFILAIRQAMISGQYDPKTFINKLSNNRAGIYKCAKTHQYLSLIEEVYNRYERQKLRF